MIHVEVEGWRVFAFFGKNHDSPEYATQGYRFNSQSEAEPFEWIALFYTLKK